MEFQPTIAKIMVMRAFSVELGRTVTTNEKWEKEGETVFSY